MLAVGSWCYFCTLWFCLIFRLLFQDKWWWLGFLAFAVWATIPFGVVAVASHRFRAAAAALKLLLLASLLLTVSAMCLLYDAFVARPDAQSGILFVFLPVWQMIGLAPFLLGSRFLHRRRTGA